MFLHELVTMKYFNSVIRTDTKLHKALIIENWLKFNLLTEGCLSWSVYYYYNLICGNYVGKFTFSPRYRSYMINKLIDEALTEYSVTKVTSFVQWYTMQKPISPSHRCLLKFSSSYVCQTKRLIAPGGTMEDPWTQCQCYSI